MLTLVPSPPVVVPPFDPFGLPASPTLFLVLIVVTTWLHVLFMNFALGGSLLAVALDLLSLLRFGRHDETVNTVWRVMPVALSLTITTGVAPLLFVQVLFGPLFYPANVFMGAAWLALIPLLIVAFYLVYGIARRTQSPDLSPNSAPRQGAVRRLALGALVAVLVLTVAWVLTNNHMLSLQPAEWGRGGAWTQNRLSVTPAVTIPRYLHFVGGSVAVAGAWLVVIGLWRRRDAEATAAGRALTATGVRVTLAMTLTAAAGGVAMLLSLPPDQRNAMLRPRDPLAALWMLAVCGVAGQAALAIACLRRPESAGRAGALAVLVALTLGGMVCGREQLRAAFAMHPEVRFDIHRWPVRLQQSSLWLFAGLAVAAIATIAWLVVGVVRTRRRPLGP